MENSCWQILLQSNAFQDWTDREKEAIANLFYYKGDLEDIKINDVFPTSHEQKTNYAERFSSPIHSSEYVDKRIRAIKFYNFRLFPSPENDEKPYGVDFTKQGAPCSLFLVGGNGTGKSSVYSALEMHYTDFCSHAEEMGCDKTEYLTFGLNNLKGVKKENVTLGVLRQDCRSGNNGYEELKQKFEDFQPICSSNSFCSDYDAEQIKQSGKILYSYILKQLGYKKFEDIVTRVSKMNENLEEMAKGLQQDPEAISSAELNVVILNFLRSINDGDDDIKECELFISPEEIKKEIEGVSPHLLNSKLFGEQWEIARKARKASTPASNPGIIVQNATSSNAEYVKQVSTLSGLYYELRKILLLKKNMRDDEKYHDETNLLLTLVENMMKRKRDLENTEYRQIIDTNNANDILKKIKILEKIKTLIIETQHQIVLRFQQKFQDEISDVLESFSEYGETYKVVVSSNTFDIDILVPTVKEPFHATPFEYFNSFRFKLFCITLKICLSIYWMQQNKTIVPFVIDDVFNANDFNNGLKLEHFVYNIYKWYDVKLQRADRCKIPLQLIMLTHDDLMLSAFKKGFMYMSESDLIENCYCKKSLDNLRCGRIFPYRAIAHEYKEKETNKDFKNLYIDYEGFC